MGLFGKKKQSNTFSTSTSDFGKGIDSKSKTFDDLMQEFESLGKDKSIEFCFEIMKKTINKLDEKQLMAYTLFMFWSVSVDGKLTEEEFLLTKPVFSIIMKEDDMDYNFARGYVKSISHRDAVEYGEKVSEITMGLLSELDKETATDVLMTGVLLSACDGHICEEEKAFLKKIIL